MKKLSRRAKTVLIDIRDGRGVHSFCSRPAYLGRMRILTALQDRGFVDHKRFITKAGLAYLECR